MFLLNFQSQNNFNNSCIVGLYVTKPSRCTTTHCGLFINNTQESDSGCHGLGNLNMTTPQQNKQTTFLNRSMDVSSVYLRGHTPGCYHPLGPRSLQP